MKLAQTASYEEAQDYVNTRIDKITTLLLNLNQEEFALTQFLLELKNEVGQEKFNELFM